MKKTKMLFILGSGVYPHKVGGMEIFNYYFIQNIENKFDITYSSTLPLNIKGIKWLKMFSIKPIKLFAPLQVLLQLLLRPSIKKVVISYSDAHWLVWYIYTMINTLFKREYYVIIHYGEIPPQRTFKVYNTFFNKAKRVIAVSGDIKKNYDNRFDINCEVLFPLVPFEKCNTEKSVLRNKYGISEDSFLITMVGSVKDMKNPDTLLEALSLFTKRERELYKLHIAYAGTGNMQGLLKEKTQQLGLGEIVHFLGFIPKEDVNEIFKMSDAYTIASDFEGTSVSLLEAMYNKLPIFASHAPGIKDMIIENHSALMFKTRNAEELKKQILSVLSNPQLAKSLSYNAYKDFIQKYDYNRIIDRYVEIFNE